MLFPHVCVEYRKYISAQLLSSGHMSLLTTWSMLPWDPGKGMCPLPRYAYKSSKTKPPPTPPLSSLAPSLYTPLSETTPHKGVEVPPPYAHTTAASTPNPNPTPPCRTASPSAPNPCHHPRPAPNPVPTHSLGDMDPADLLLWLRVLLAEATCLAPVSIHNPLSSRTQEI